MDEAVPLELFKNAFVDYEDEDEDQDCVNTSIESSGASPEFPNIGTFVKVS